MQPLSELEQITLDRITFIRQNFEDKFDMGNALTPIMKEAFFEVYKEGFIKGYHVGYADGQWGADVRY